MQQAQSKDSGSAVEAAASQVWEHIKASARTVEKNGSCCLAAGALCSVLTPRAKRLVSTITLWLVEHVASAR